jgi:hypothetical protein
MQKVRTFAIAFEAYKVAYTEDAIKLWVIGWAGKPTLKLWLGSRLVINPVRDTGFQPANN